jgi:CheY-like chemotaxis protein
VNHFISAADLRVLVVDDHDISRDSTVSALQGYCAEVRSASCPSAALEIAIDWLPGAIVTDLRLGNQSGISLISAIRQRWPSDVSRPRVVLISAGPFQPGADDDTVDEFLSKPIRAKSLLAAVTGMATPARSPVRETGSPLIEVFRKELETRREDLDLAVAAYRLEDAGAILHQLIASSAMCGVPELEARFRTLEKACRSRAEPAALAPAYVAAARAISTFLGTAA